MSEEIFGPILPIVTMRSVGEAVDFVRNRDHPLVMYVFSEGTRTRRHFENEVTAGAVVHGAALVHLAVPDLPFGGVATSGMGSSHGKKSVQTFSRDKAVLAKPTRPETLSVIPPPYGHIQNWIVRTMFAG